MKNICRYLILLGILFGSCSEDDSPTPEIISISQDCGLPGNSVSLMLANFKYDNLNDLIARVGGIDAEIIDEFDEGIVIIIPYTAQSGKVSLELNGIEIFGPYFEVLNFLDEDKGFDFFVTFKLQQFTYEYRNTENYEYYQGRSLTVNLNNDLLEVEPYSYFTKDLDGFSGGASRIIDFAFVDNNFQGYESTEAFKEETWTDIGNAVFQINTYDYCLSSSGINTSFQDCLNVDNLGIKFIWQDDTNTFWSPAFDHQPQSSKFEILSIKEDPFISRLHSGKSFQKILSGTFKCRLYQYQNETNYIDLTNGSFRIPVWVNQYEPLVDGSWTNCDE